MLRRFLNKITREHLVVFAPALLAAAKKIVLVHNHPNGDPEPSEADVIVTNDAIAAGTLLEIPIADHLVIGALDGGFTSMRNAELCDFETA